MSSEEGRKAGERVIPHRAVLAVLFVAYVVTRYPDVGGRINMGDSAKFQFLARVMGIGHAPGNPLYLMLSALWVRLPLPLADATKVTLLSSVAGIATIALASAAVGVLGLPPVFRVRFSLETRSFAAILLGFGSLFWTLSTEAEVYTLGAVFVAAVLYGIARWSIRHERRGLYLAIGALGLGLANHLTIAALGPAVLYVLLREREGRAALRSIRFWAVALGALGLAAASYGWIAWRVKSGPLAYSEFPGTLDGSTFLGFVTARSVMASTAAPTSFLSILERLPDLFAQLQKQWPWPLLLVVPFGFLHLARQQRAFTAFVALGVLGHFAIGLVFRIPDPEGLFVPVSTLLVVPLALAPAGLAAALRGDELRATSQAATVVLALHGIFATAHVMNLLRQPFSAYTQRTPEGQVVLNLPTLHEVVPEHAMVAVPCGHYGCVEVMSYYALVDRELHDKDVSFMRFSWSEWDNGKLPVALVDPRAKRTRPLCVLLTNDVKKLTEQGLAPTPIPRAPAQVLGRRFTSPPLHCLMP